MDNLKLIHLINDYQSFLNNNLIVSTLSENCFEIQLPITDCHNDFIVVYCLFNENNILLTDAGFVLNDLITCGCDLNETTLTKITSIIKKYNVSLNNKELITNASTTNFSNKLFSIQQAIIAVTYSCSALL